MLADSASNVTDQNRRSTLNDSPMETGECKDSQDQIPRILDTDASTIENVQSPAYSDISDANDTDTEMKSSSLDKNPEHTGLVLNVAGDVAKLPNSSNYGMYSFLNQPPYMLPVDQRGEDSSRAT